MKKILLAILLVAALSGTSCQNKAESESLTNESNITFIVEKPEMATRVFGDGTQSNDLYYGIYDAEGNLISEISKVDESNKESILLSKSINLRLVTGNTYSMIFWADSAGDACDVDFATKTMTFDPKLANQEAYDAFWAYVEPFKVTSDMSKTVELYRPFAQLNIGTDDIETASAAGLDVAESQVTVTTPNSLNLITGVVSGEQKIIYAYATIPTNETFPVADHDYLSMNYLLVGANKSTIDVEFAYSDGTSEYTQKYTFVPVQRNYRTNIYGSVLTSSVDVNVVIEPTFDEPDYVVSQTGSVSVL